MAISARPVLCSAGRWAQTTKSGHSCSASRLMAIGPMRVASALPASPLSGHFPQTLPHPPAPPPSSVPLLRPGGPPFHPGEFPPPLLAQSKPVTLSPQPPLPSPKRKPPPPLPTALHQIPPNPLPPPPKTRGNTLKHPPPPPPPLPPSPPFPPLFSASPLSPPPPTPPSDLARA